MCSAHSGQKLCWTRMKLTLGQLVSGVALLAFWTTTTTCKMHVWGVKRS